jgi:hypothetical protein
MGPVDMLNELCKVAASIVLAFIFEKVPLQQPLAAHLYAFPESSEQARGRD